MSFIVTYLNIGLTEDFISRWLSAIPFVFMCAFPLTFVFSPLARKLTLLMVNENREIK